MGNTVSETVQPQLYILRVTNKDLPLCPFIHSIVKFGDTPVAEQDPRVFKDILAREDLVLEVRDLLQDETFKVRIPRGTSQLGINVVRMTEKVRVLCIRITSVLEGCALQTGDNILGVENMYIATEDDLIAYIKSHAGESLPLVILREGKVVVEHIECAESMGCEVWTGMVYAPEAGDYYLQSYTGVIPRVVEKPAPLENSEMVSKETEVTSTAPPTTGFNPIANDAQVGPEIQPGSEGHTEPVEYAPMDGDQTVNSFNDREKTERNDTEEVSCNLSVDSTHTADYSKHEISPEANKGTEQSITQDAPQPTAFPTSQYALAAQRSINEFREHAGPTDQSHPKSIDRSASDRICAAVGVPNESELLTGSVTEDDSIAIIMNGTLVDRDDCMLANGTCQMKKEAFEQRKDLLADPSHAIEDDNLAVVKGVPLESIKALEDQTIQKNTIEQLFDDDSTDLPFMVSSQTNSIHSCINNSEQTITGRMESMNVHNASSMTREEEYASGGALGSAQDSMSAVPTNNNEVFVAGSSSVQCASNPSPIHDFDRAQSNLYSHDSLHTASDPLLSDPACNFDEAVSDRAVSDNESI